MKQRLGLWLIRLGERLTGPPPRTYSSTNAAGVYISWTDGRPSLHPTKMTNLKT